MASSTDPILDNDARWADRRKFPRMNGDFPTDVIDTAGDPLPVTLSARTVNVSRQGLGIEANTDLALGTQLSVSVQFDGRDSICLCQLLWKRRSDGGFSYGALVKRWSYLDPALELALGRLQRLAARAVDNGPDSLPAAA
jgi:hypothetical protein